MWYMPFVRVRRAVLIYAALVLGVSLLAVALRWWPGAVGFNGREAATMASLRVDLSMLLAGAAALVGGFATVLGLNLAAENDGHLELAWTKPVSRVGYALGVFAVDLAAIAVCVAFTLVCSCLVVDIDLGHQGVNVADGWQLLRALAFCGFPVLVYAWITALSASVRRGRGSVAAVFWPAIIAIGVLQLVPIPAVHAIAGALNAVSPVGIYHRFGPVPTPSTATFASGWAVSAILLAVALAQWRRLEM